MKIALGQINPTVLALSYNEQKIIDFCHNALNMNANLIFFPELALTGYPPKDLLFNRDFLNAVQVHLANIARRTPLPAVIGATFENASGDLFNAAFLCENNQVKLVAKKVLLPNYFVFDEKRYFKSAEEGRCQSFVFQNKKFLLAICEDAWADEIHYGENPLQKALEVEKDVDFIITMAASPYLRHKPNTREKLFANIAVKAKKPSLMVSQVGGMDQVVFDGSSLVFDGQGHLQAHGRFGEEDLVVFDDLSKNDAPSSVKLLNEQEQILKILTLGIKDYVEKCRAPGVILGLSGGMDSAVVAALAVKALGKEKVRAYFLKSQYSKESSHTDAKVLADNLGIFLHNISIENLHKNAHELLKEPTKDALAKSLDLMDQNLQSRLRMLVLMGLSNASNHLVLGTSNKSEMAVGYTTIYGDMAGALCPLGDLYKTEVVALARHLNTQGPSALIPEEIFAKEPSAELKHHQKDRDNLPPYDILDRILRHLIDRDRFSRSFNEPDVDHQTVRQIANLVHLSEYKRRQAPPVILVSERGFGEARRIPIAKHIDEP